MPPATGQEELLWAMSSAIPSSATQVHSAVRSASVSPHGLREGPLPGPSELVRGDWDGTDTTQEFGCSSRTRGTQLPAWKPEL